MKSETRLDSALFQLTPTRTRCDLVIIANGKTEKIASGLLEPFLAHLKTARDQIAKGGYSIALEPDPESDVTWFTKGTVERFVRFVSTPEVLERVNTVESEMSQIDEAIAIQSSENLGLGPVEDHQSKSKDQGSRPAFDADSGKAIVLFKPGVHPESNGSTTLEENSKVQLLRVLETRKTVLQKEQGMAFARAVAAGFEMDHMVHLLSFAENFGASRLMEACTRFMELWKRKHETGQWLEIEATEAISCQADFSSLNSSGIVISHGELGVDINGKASNESSSNISYQQLSSDHHTDKKPSIDTQVPLGPHQYIQGNFQHAMYPPWPIHSPSGAPVFQAYPMQGMPYYQNYQAGGAFFQPPYPPMEDPKFNGAHIMGQKMHSLDSKGGNLESETWEMGVSNGRSQDGTDRSMSEKEVVQGQESRRKVNRSVKTKSGVVVIRNINYITSKRNDVSGSESESASVSDEEAEELRHDAPERKHKNSMRSSKGKESQRKSTATWTSNDRDDIGYGQEADSANWQAFQNCLLRVDEESTKNVNRRMFSPEKEALLKRRQSTAGSDPLLQRDSGEAVDQWTSKFDVVSDSATQTYKQRASSDELAISHEGLHSRGGRLLRESHLDVQFTKIEGGRGGFKKGARDDFIIHGQGNQHVTNSHLDPLAANEFGYAHNFDKSSSQNAMDESFIVPFRSSSQDQVGSDRRAAIDMDSDVLTTLQRTQDSSNRIRSRANYEPDYLRLMSQRGTERESTGYDLAVNHEMEVRAEDGKMADNADRENVSTGNKEGLKKLDKIKKSRVQDPLEKRKMEAAMRKGKLSKSNPLAEAQARAERLRAFKADLQKMKREKEEEEMKRLEALKRERQKRIAARSSSSPAHPPSPSQQIKSRLPTKLSVGMHKASKFNDSEPGSSSPIQRFTKFTSARSNSPRKTTKLSRSDAARLAGNGLSRSASSLPELKKKVTSPEPKAVTIRARRLSDPKGSSGHRAILKSGGSVTPPKPKLTAEPQIKKISAINSLDRTKSAALSELKIKTSRRNSDIVQNKSAAEEIKQKKRENRSSLTSESVKLEKSDEKIPHNGSEDDNPVIEKTVVVLENEICTIPFVQTSEENIQDKRGAYDDGSVQITVGVTEYAAIHAPASPTVIGEIDKVPSQFQLDVHPISNEVMMGNASDRMLKSSSTEVSEKPYPAPYARVSSLEDPCTSNSEYSKALAGISEVETITETVKAHISDSIGFNSLDMIPGSLEKPRGKESSKGFRRLLKFGRKNHCSSAGECNMETDKSSTHGSVIDDHAHSYPNEVHTLKNLISQDDSPVGTPHKVSRPFSLLSPFRSKNSEKKLIT